nr:E3 ubiquitin-protein ligase RING1-like [Ipomoea batatas]
MVGCITTTLVASTASTCVLEFGGGMDSPAVLIRHECNVSVGHDIMGGFENTSERGFYFQFVVRERTLHYYFSGINNNVVNYYNEDTVQRGCWRFVVKVEEIMGCEDTAIHAITEILRTINICETVQPEMVRKIYSTVNSLARQAEHVSEMRIPVMVDIERVFRQAVPNPHPNRLSQLIFGDGDRDRDRDMDRDEDEDEDEDEEEEEVEGGPVLAARSAVAALEKVKLKPKETCSICLGGLIKATRMPCSHVFHQRCIVRWLKRSNECPLCRFQLPTDN